MAGVKFVLIDFMLSLHVVVLVWLCARCSIHGVAFELLDDLLD